MLHELSLAPACKLSMDELAILCGNSTASWLNSVPANGLIGGSEMSVRRCIKLLPLLFVLLVLPLLLLLLLPIRLLLLVAEVAKLVAVLAVAVVMVRLAMWRERVCSVLAADWRNGFGSGGGTTCSPHEFLTTTGGSMRPLGAVEATTSGESERSLRVDKLLADCAESERLTRERKSLRLVLTC